MLRTALTGGIGAGKSTVSRRLKELGAVLVDADVHAREVVEPGTPGLAAVVKAFGTEVLREDGRLDRPALGRLVFADREQLALLNSIIHPLVRARSQEVVAAAPADAVVVHDVPLLVESRGVEGFDLVMVVWAPEPERVRRLVEDRGMDAEDAAARIRAQASDEERAAVADVVFDNSGPVAATLTAVDHFWRERIEPLRHASVPVSEPRETGGPPPE
jgi:dephospho-CoA kinase